MPHYFLVSIPIVCHSKMENWIMHMLDIILWDLVLLFEINNWIRNLESLTPSIELHRYEKINCELKWSELINVFYIIMSFTCNSCSKSLWSTTHTSTVIWISSNTKMKKKLHKQNWGWKFQIVIAMLTRRSLRVASTFIVSTIGKWPPHSNRTG